MANPHLTGASFSQLHSGQGQSSSGTVTGTTIAVNDAVHIAGSGHKTWDGSVTSSAGGNVWNATVTRSGSSASAKSAMSAMAGQGGPIADATETVSVTVTNTDGDSNPVNTDPNIVP
jgi:hypothetical protein